MKVSRLIVSVVLALSIGSLGACDDNSIDKAEVKPTNSPLSSATPSASHRDIAAFAGTWRYAPAEPHAATDMVIDEVGEVTVEETMVNAPWIGTIRPGDGATFVIELESPDNPSWTLTLTPTGDDTVFDVVTGDNQRGTFTRIS